MERKHHITLCYKTDHTVELFAIFQTWSCGFIGLEHRFCSSPVVTVKEDPAAYLGGSGAKIGMIVQVVTGAKDYLQNIQMVILDKVDYKIINLAT